MKTFARVATLGLLCTAAFVVNACSSDDDDTKSPAPDGKTAPAFPLDKANQTYVSEAEACAKIVAAYDKVLKRENCTYTGVALQCPSYLRNGAPTNKCADFDQGVIDYCAGTYIPSLTCNQLAGNPCILVVRPNPTAAAAGTCDAAGGAGGAGGASGAAGAAGAEAGGAAGESAGGAAGAAAGGSAGAAAAGAAGAAAGGSAGAAAGGAAGAAAGGSAGAAAGSAGADAGGSAGASGADAGGSAGAAGAAAGAAGAGS